MLKRGAEAVITAVEWRGRPAVEKHRAVKGYRHPALDAEVRRLRLRREVRLMAEARRAGVPVPIVYDVDLAGDRLVLQRIEGPTAKDLLHSPGDWRPLCRDLGGLAGRLHAAGIVHGDLTTSNVLRADDRLYLIDFSLGEKTESLESRGVDLRLLQEAFQSAHYDHPDYLEAVESAYREAFPLGAAVLEKVREIEGRGRYT